MPATITKKCQNVVDFIEGMDEYIGKEISLAILKYPSIAMGVLVSDYGALRL